MPQMFGDLPPALRKRLIDNDPILSKQQETIRSNLEAQCKKTEEFIAKYGSTPYLDKFLVASRQFIKGEISPEEYQELMR